MPYARNSELPERVKSNIPSKAGKDLFRNVVNSQLEAGKSETVAFASAWAALQDAGYEQSDDDKWIKKNLPASGSIHVDGPLEVDEEETDKASGFAVGDVVRWNSSGGIAEGRIKRIVTDGEVPGISGDVTVTGSEESPAAQIAILDDDGEETDTIVGHKLTTLNKADTFNAPASARNNAKRVLRWKEEHGDEVKGMTRVGWTRANQLANNENLTLDTVKRIAQFERHRQNSRVAPEFKSEPWKDAGHVAWLGWGGDAGIKWAQSVVDRVEGTEKGAEQLDMFKRQLNDDQFTTVQEAVARSFDLGLNGAIHVHEDADGFGLYMPGQTHDNYLNRIREMGELSTDTAALSEATGDEGLLATLGRLFQQLADVRKSRQPAKPAEVEKVAFESKILKMDPEQRIVWGWASVISENGKPFVDHAGHMIKPEVLMKAATDFMLSVRKAKAMHEGKKVGEVVHSLPLTKELADAFGIKTNREGWIIAQKINDDETWQKVKDGEYKAFSIGGRAIINEVSE